MAQTTIHTYHDVLDHLLDVCGSSSEERELKLARRAIESAYRVLPNEKKWSYFYKHFRITTDASYSTGTITYDHTGGTNEREATLASGTWPTNAARGVIVISNVPYHVETRVSDTVITLSINSNPGGDLAAGTSYEWQRRLYTLPVDIQSAERFIDHDESNSPAYVPPSDWLNSYQNYTSSNRPRTYTFLRDPDYRGAMAVGLHRAPDQVYKYEVMGQQQPVAMRTPNYTTGTVTVSGTTVTGVSTAWTDDMIGAVIRFGDATNIPDGLAGTNPFAEERIVTARASATSLTIDAILSGTYSSATKYRISSMVDVEQGAMFTAFLRLAESELSLLLNREDVDSREMRYKRSLVSAKEADSRSFADRSPGIDRSPYRLRNRGNAGADIG